MKNAPVLLLAFFLFIGSAIQAQNYYEQAEKEYWKDSADFIGAIQLFTKAIDNNQQVAQAYMYRGSCRRLLGQFSMAEKDLTTSLRLDSTNYKVYGHIGKLYFDQQDYGTAMQYYNKAISINNKAAILYADRATAKAASGDYAGTVADESMALSLDSTDSDSWLNRGFAKYKLKEYTGALKDLDKAVKLAPVYKAFANRGAVLFELKQYQRAIDDFTRELVTVPGDYEVLWFRGRAYNALGMKDKGCADLKKSAELGYAPAKEELGKEHCN